MSHKSLRKRCRRRDGQPKDRYQTPKAARAALWRWRTERGAAVECTNMYPCPKCGFWHIGRIIRSDRGWGR